MSIGSFLGGIVKKILPGALKGLPIVGGLASGAVERLFGGGKAANLRDQGLTGNAALLQELATRARQRLQQTDPLRTAAQNALQQVIAQGPRMAPDLRGVVDRANPFRANFAMPSAPRAVVSSLPTPPPAGLLPPPPAVAGAISPSMSPVMGLLDQLRKRTSGPVPRYLT